MSRSSLHTTTTQKGFTLIELLVVIAIIGVLSSVILASLNTARTKSRDAKRISDLRQLQVALEFHFDDTGTYPDTSDEWWGTCSAYGSHDDTGANGWVPDLAPNFLPVLPRDPNEFGTTGCYIYRSDGADYKVIAHGTMEALPCPPVSATHALYDPTRSPSQCTVGIYTPGAESW